MQRARRVEVQVGDGPPSIVPIDAQWNTVGDLRRMMKRRTGIQHLDAPMMLVPSGASFRDDDPIDIFRDDDKIYVDPAQRGQQRSRTPGPSRGKGRQEASGSEVPRRQAVHVDPSRGHGDRRTTLTAAQPAFAPPPHLAAAGGTDAASDWENNIMWLSINHPSSGTTRVLCVVLPFKNLDQQKELLGAAHNLAQECWPEDEIEFDDQDDGSWPEAEQALLSMQLLDNDTSSQWFCTAMSSEMCAIGVGPQKQNRIRSAKLALAVASRCLGHGPARARPYPSFDGMVEYARRLLSSAPARRARGPRGGGR